MNVDSRVGFRGTIGELWEMCLRFAVRREAEDEEREIEIDVISRRRRKGGRCLCFSREKRDENQWSVVPGWQVT